MKNIRVWCTPIIPANSSDDWVSDDELPEEECKLEKPDDPSSTSSSMKVQYQLSIESLKDRKIVLKKESYKNRLCRSCKGEESIDSKTENQNKCCLEKSEKLKSSAANNFESVEDSESDSEILDPPQAMKPVPLDLKRHIYKGISHDEKGKMKYLNIRYCTPPEERWNYPITSSMQIGWTFGYPQKMKAPEFGRKMTMYRSFFRSNDTQLKPRDLEQI